jgi:hypothetical protein
MGQSIDRQIAEILARLAFLQMIERALIASARSVRKELH